MSGRLVEKLGDVRYVYTWRGERIFKVVSFYLLRAGRGRIGELDERMRVEVAEARWLPLEDAPRLLAYDGEREMARTGDGRECARERTRLRRGTSSASPRSACRRRCGATSPAAPRTR